jgi:hypothetical protein
MIVYPAITHPHKNHRFLLELMARHWSDPELRLVLLGGRGAAEAEVQADIARLGLEHRVVRPGRVPDATATDSSLQPMHWCFRASTRASGHLRWRRWRSAPR